jgi:hypothetical protein
VSETFLPGIINFSREWQNAKSFPFKTLVNIWFEYDFENIEKNILKPNFFYAPAEGSHPFEVVSTTQTVLETIAGETVEKETLIQLLHSLHQLPKNGWVSQIGKMFAREETSLRLFIQEIPCNGIGNYLDKINYSYAHEENLNQLLDCCYHYADQVDLDIDVGETIGNTIGLECSFNEMKTAVNFLEYLLINGFCTQQKHEALNIYLRNLRLNYQQEFWAFFSHFKITYNPLKPFKTKAYLGFAQKNSAFQIIRTKAFK